MTLFDSHAHYWDDKLKDDTATLISAFFSTGGVGVVNVGTSPETSRLAAEQARICPHMVTALGIHPTDAAELTGTPEAEVDKIRAMLLEPSNRAVAVGEIGLDFHWEPYDRTLQQTYFDLQMELARELSLPVVVHDRDAHGACLDTVRRYPDVRGVFHSYSGSAEEAHELCRRGWYISFSGTLTFKNACRVREVAASVPRERILIETDAPYLTPHPHRGERNHSGYLHLTCEVLAEVLGVTPDEASAITYENARALFRLPF